MTIARVRIAGVGERLAAALAGELATRAGMSLADAPLGDDLRRLWKLGVIDDARIVVGDGEVAFVLTPRPTITSVVRRGGDALAQARFRQLVETPFEPVRLQRMTEALQASYVRQGRLDARVEARQRVHATGVDVCVAVDPGPRVTIAKLEFPGARVVPAKTLRAALHGAEANVNRIGGSLDEAALELDSIFLQSEYWERGHLDVKLGKPTVKRRGARLEVAIPVEEGPQYRLGAIDAPVATSLRTGDVFVRSQVAAAREAIQTALGAYDVLPLTHVDLEARRVDISFDIEWRYPWDGLRFWLSRSHSPPARPRRR